jgi:hypothetical protein
LFFSIPVAKNQSSGGANGLLIENWGGYRILLGILHQNALPMTSMDAWRHLSAAEITLLREPEKEQTSTVLPLLLKELVLKRWVQVRTGTRPLPTYVVLVGGIFCIGAFFTNMVVGIAAFLILILAYRINLKKNHHLLLITPLGEQQATAGIHPTFLHEFLADLRVVVEKNRGNCTWPEFLAHLSKKYESNKNFYQKGLSQGLLVRRLIVWEGTQQKYARTESGNEMLAAIEQRLHEGMPLASLVRKKSPEALQLLLALGGLALLLPNMQGYYTDLLELLPNDIDTLQQRPEHAYTSDGGGVSNASDDDKKPDHPDASPEDTSFDENWFDSLDGDLLDGSLDSNMGGDLDTSDGGSSDGGSDGDGGGDGGGCGGGCGGD